MTIQFQVFTIPVNNPQDANTDLNQFLRTVRVLTVHKEFVSNTENSFWSLLVEYLPGTTGSTSSKTGKANKPKVDYREVLSPEDFAVFVKLRDWRKMTAEKEGVPVYVVFTNEQLAAIVQKKVASSSDLQKIEGVGEGRVNKYGDAVLSVMSTAMSPQNTDASSFNG